MNEKSTELLIIKTENAYIRITDRDYETCTLEKASVFPLDHLSDVKQHTEALQQRHGITPGVFKLTIVEEPFLA